MTEFDLEALVLSTIALVTAEGGTVGLLSGQPGAKQSRGVEGCLEIAENLKGGDVRRFVDC